MEMPLSGRYISGYVLLSLGGASFIAIMWRLLLYFGLLINWGSYTSAQICSAMSTTSPTT